MADGRSHEVYNRRGWIIIFPLAPIIYFVGTLNGVDYPILYWLFLYLNYLITEILSPDADHSSRTKDESDALKIFRAINIGVIVPISSTKKNRVLLVLKRILSRIGLGILGALYVGWVQVYEFFCMESADLVGSKKSHRVWFSHWWFIGTIGRMIWFNIPVIMIYSYLVNYSISNWGTPPLLEIGWRYFWLNMWGIPYIITQFISWFIADATHLLLDTEYAKGRLYGWNNKYPDRRTKKIKLLLKILKIKDGDVDAKEKRQPTRRKR